MSIPFLRNHPSVATRGFHKLPKISLEGSRSFYIHKSCLKQLWQPHLSNYLVASLAHSSLFVCFSQHIFLCQLLEDHPLQFLRKLSLIWTSVCSPSPVSRQCPHLCISPSWAPVFILSSIGPSVSAFTHKQRLCHLLAGPFILRVAAITGE